MVKAVVMVTSMMINHYPGHRFRDQIPKEDNSVTPSVKEGNLEPSPHTGAFSPDTIWRVGGVCLWDNSSRRLVSFEGASPIRRAD